MRLAVLSLIAPLTLLSAGFAMAEEMEPAKQCDGLSDVFSNYSSKRADPDVDKATALSLEASSDCKDGRFDDGINKYNNAIGMMHDGVDSGRSGRR